MSETSTKFGAIKRRVLDLKECHAAKLRQKQVSTLPISTCILPEMDWLVAQITKGGKCESPQQLAKIAARVAKLKEDYYDKVARNGFMVEEVSIIRDMDWLVKQLDSGEARPVPEPIEA